MDFARCNNVFSLASPFPDGHGVVGSHVLVELDYRMDSKMSDVNLQNDRTHGLLTPEPDCGLR